MPPKVELKDKFIAPTINSQCELHAVIDGIPTPEIKWFKDDQLLAEGNDILLKREGNICQLLLMKSTPEHSGVYKCFAENVVGKADAKATVSIHGM